MATVLAERDIDPITLRFGYGVNTQLSDTVINEQECARGKNFRLDLGDVEFRPRRAFDLRGTIPISGPIDGFAQLKKRDGTLATIVQSGTKAWVWDGNLSGFTDTGITLAAGTKLRGHPRQHNWSLDDKVLISDLALQNVVLEYDGTTLQPVAFKNSAGSDFGALKARYIFVADERAYYANVETTTITEHLMAGSKISEYATVADTGTATDPADPFWVLTPDLKPINGVLGAFGLTLVSSEEGSIFNITGIDATDFQLSDTYPLSAVRGREALAYIGNDIAYGLQGRLEILRQGSAFNQYVSGNLGFHIEDSIENVDSWTIIHNRRRQVAYVFPQGASFCWVLDKKMYNFEPRLSPWSLYETRHPMAFQPTCAWAMFDPLTGLEEVYMGDSSGNIYQLEGAGAGDAGSYDIWSRRVSRVISVPASAKAYDLDCWIYYRKDEAPVTVQVEARWAGSTVYDLRRSITLPPRASTAFYGGSQHFGQAGVYFGSAFAGRLQRQQVSLSGSGSDLQIAVESTGRQEFAIERIEMRPRVAG